MPNFEVSFYLKTGGTAKVSFENAPSLTSTKQSIEGHLAAPGTKLQMSNATNIISLNKDEIIGYSVEQL